MKLQSDLRERSIKSAILAAILLFVLMVFARPVYADTINTTFNASSQTYNATKQLVTGTSGSEWVITIKNDTKVAVTYVGLELDYSLYNGNGNYSTEEFSVTSGEGITALWDDVTVKDHVYETEAITGGLIEEIPAGGTAELHIFYKGHKTAEYMQCHVKVTAALAKTYTESGAKLSFDKTYDTAASYCNKYYFHLDKAAKITVTTQSASAYDYEIEKTDGWGDFTTKKSGTITSTGLVSKTYKMRAGDFMIAPDNDGADLSIKITKTDIKWGTLKISVKGNKVTATYTDAASADADDVENTYISYWACGTQGDYVDGKSKKVTKTIDTTKITYPGWTDGYFTVVNESYGDTVTLKKTFSHFKSPKKPGTFTLKAVTTNKVITDGLGNSNNGDHIQVQIYQKGKWVNKKVVDEGHSATITGLKKNTVYKIRIKGMVVAKGHADKTTKASPTVTFRTGTSTKPSVKSIKVSGAKYTYHKAVAASGYWDVTGHWQRTAAQPAYWTTSYKVTVTLKKRVSGPAGICVNGVYKKGSGKKFTVTCSSLGKVKGKKVKFSICYANNSAWGGKSPATTKKAKVR